MQRRKHIKVCLLMLASERRWFCVLISSEQGQVEGEGGGGRGEEEGEGEEFARYQVDAIDIQLHTINHGQDLTITAFFFSPSSPYTQAWTSSHHKKT